jgi:tellurite resistance protein
MMNKEPFASEEHPSPPQETAANHNPLSAMRNLQGMLTKSEELAFMQILFSSSATIRNANFGLSRKEVEKILGIADDEGAFQSFLTRLNQALSRYFQVIYDQRRDQVVALMRVTARQAKEVLSKESLSILMFIFYHQEVLQNEYTLFSQLVESFGHESLKAAQRIRINLDTLRKIGAIEPYDNASDEEAYQLTAIGSHMFSDSFLRRTAEFSQSNQLHMEDVLRFFKRYNLEGGVAHDSLET